MADYWQVCGTAVVAYTAEPMPAGGCAANGGCMALPAARVERGSRDLEGAGDAFKGLSLVPGANGLPWWFPVPCTVAAQAPPKTYVAVHLTVFPYEEESVDGAGSQRAPLRLPS